MGGAVPGVPPAWGKNFHAPFNKKRPAVPHRPFPHKRDTLERILQSNAHAIGILIHFIDDLLSPRSLIQVEAHIRGLDGEFQIFINLVAGVRVQFPRVVGRGEIGRVCFRSSMSEMSLRCRTTPQRPPGLCPSTFHVAISVQPPPKPSALTAHGVLY